LPKEKILVPVISSPVPVVQLLFALDTDLVSKMASSEINVIAIVTPHPDKFSIVEDMIKDLTLKVQQNEPGVLAYQAHTERKKDGSGTIVFVEK
jgi:hypothetical protein